MEAGIVDCEAVTMENPVERVDTKAITVEKLDKVNSDQITKLRPSVLTLTYKIDDPNSKIIPYLPKGKIVKLRDESTKFGRTENFDVFLNDECMSRNYIHIYPQKDDSSKFIVKNFSSSKLAILDGHKLEMNAWCYIENNSFLQLDIISFLVSIQCGDQNADKYVIHVLPEKQQQKSMSPAIVHDLHWSHMSPQVQNPIHWPQMSPQIQNSVRWPQMSPQVQNSVHWPQMSPQVQNGSCWPQMSPQIQNGSSWLQMSTQNQNPQRWSHIPPRNQNSQHWSQMPPQDPNSQHWPHMPPQDQNPQRWPHMPSQDPNSQRWSQNQNPQRWPQMPPQYPNSQHQSQIALPTHSSFKNKSEFSSMDKMPPSFSYPSENGSSLREPQEHAMSSEEDFHSEKQKQHQMIEDMSRK